jgi:hypothetical protein
MKRLCCQTILFAALHYISLLCLRGGELIVSHIPPSVVNLDWLVVGLMWLERFLIAPRLLLRALWPSLNNSTALILALTIINSLLWGFALAWWRAQLRRRRGDESLTFPSVPPKIIPDKE